MNIRQYLFESEVFSNQWAERHEKWQEMYNDLNIKPESMLNIGIGPKFAAQKWTKFLHTVFPSLTYFENLELDNNIVQKAKRRKNIYISNIEQGDIKNISDIYGKNSFDLIFWSHGPEHISREDWADTFAQLEVVAKQAIILQCPWGSGYDGHPGHLAKSIHKGEFEKYGYKTLYAGEKDTKFADIFSYKVLNED